jgi:predicted RNase H-like HicB family nuclease
MRILLVDASSSEKPVMRKYTIILEVDPEEGGYTVTFPALPGCITQGETIEQCIERAREAIAGYIESLKLMQSWMQECE